MQLKKGSFFRLKITGIYVLIFLCVFVIARIALYFSVYPFFKDLTSAEFIRTFLQGMRFDMSAICSLCGLFLFLINIPVDSKKFLKVNTGILTFLLLILSLILSADVVYFKLFGKHLTTELLFVRSHFSYFVSLALQEYVFVTASIVAASVLLFYFSFKLIGRNYVTPKKIKYLIRRFFFFWLLPCFFL